MKKPLIELNDFSGGMTLNSKQGKANQFFLGKNLDFDSYKGKITNGYSWRTVTLSGSAQPQIRTILDTKQDGNFYLGSDRSTIYNILDTITWSKVRAITGANYGVHDMDEYKSYMLYSWGKATGPKSYIGKKDLTSAYANSGYTDNAFSAAILNQSFMPIKVAPDNIAYVGFANYIYAVSDPSALTMASVLNNWNLLPANWEIRCLENFGYMHMAVGANFKGSGSSTQCRVLLWNRLDSQANDEIFIPENEVKAFKYVAGYLWIWAGRTANLYVVPEGSRHATLMHEFTTENPSDSLEVYPNSVDTRGGKIYFALSDVDSDTSGKNPAGVYSFPVEPSQFKLNMPFMGDGYNETFKALTNIRYSSNSEFLMFGYNGQNVPAVNGLRREINISLDANTDTPYKDSATLTSLYYYAPQNKLISTERFGIEFDTLPTGTTISLYYRKDAETAWTTVIENFQTANTTESFVNKVEQFGRIQFMLSITGSSTNHNYSRPKISTIYISGDIIDKP